MKVKCLKCGKEVEVDKVIRGVNYYCDECGKERMEYLEKHGE